MEVPWAGHSRQRLLGTFGTLNGVGHRQQIHLLPPPSVWAQTRGRSGWLITHTRTGHLPVTHYQEPSLPKSRSNPSRTHKHTHFRPLPEFPIFIEGSVLEYTRFPTNQPTVLTEVSDESRSNRKSTDTLIHTQSLSLSLPLALFRRTPPSVRAVLRRVSVCSFSSCCRVFLLFRSPPPHSCCCCSRGPFFPAQNWICHSGEVRSDRKCTTSCTRVPPNRPNRAGLQPKNVVFPSVPVPVESCELARHQSFSSSPSSSSSLGGSLSTNVGIHSPLPVATAHTTINEQAAAAARIPLSPPFLTHT